MTSLTAAQAGIARGQGDATPWRALAMLAVAVLAIHALVLMSSPARFGPELDPASQRVQPLVTRSITTPPAVQAAAAPAPPPPRPRPKIIKPKSPPAQSTPTPVAINNVATPVVETPAASEPSAPEAVAALAPASAASAPVTPVAPAGPAQTPVTAMALPENVKLEYKMTGSAKGLNYHANGELNWRRVGNLYDAGMRVSALFLGSRSMGSTGVVGPEGLAPIRFSDKSRSEVAAHFDPDKGQVSFSANTPSVPWIKGAQDRVSVFIQLGGMLAGNPALFPVGTTLSMYTVGPRDADTWTFLVEAEENLTLPFGEMATLKLTRQPRREFDQKVEIWYAPSLGYLPVRNKITQSNGDFIDQQLSGLSKE
ncbi:MULTISPECIES: DUF3108 domain-containing protein [unclassified Polaromonas]|uniref:DUF3108 domain-containing protein n=1 Tax=unclassified Polaromonas TaxID=2638319 RepID=UPI000F08FF34|nr:MULTISPECIES: DUF3108 domain-containing protein [unclassified Polaromonas]AYQ27405.1 DUF3108 domain-containing protein [Polaromonas sp. SP1]QGJ17752.1 DUF3108 domain-containing protein [Polaromonas sp. Pch-P]